jgi:hypothetical protein
MKSISNLINKLVLIFLFILGFGLVSAQETMTFIHPGAVNSKVDLDYVKLKIEASEQPWTKEFNDIKGKATGGSNALEYVNSSNEDEEAFNIGIERLRKRNPSYFYLESDGGNIDHFWASPTLWLDGLTQETCRDNNHHAQFVLASALHAAEVAWNQRVDLYTENTERYVAAMELMALQQLTGKMQGTCADIITFLSS